MGVVWGCAGQTRKALDGARSMLEVMGDNSRSPKAIAEEIQRRIDAVEQMGDPRQGGLFGEAVPEPQRYQEAANKIWDYFEKNVLTTAPKDGAKVPEAVFPLMPVEPHLLEGLRNFLPGFHPGVNEFQISGRTIKHIYDSRGKDLSESMLKRVLNDGVRPDEVLPNHKDNTRALALFDNLRPESKKSKSAMMAIGLAVKGDKIDVYNLMPTPKSTIEQAREYAKELAQEGRQAESSSVNPHPHLQDPKGQAHVAGESFQRSGQAQRHSTPFTPDNPEQQAAFDLMQQNPDLVLANEAGEPVSVRDVMAQLEAEHAMTQEQTTATEAAVSCALQFGD